MFFLKSQLIDSLRALCLDFGGHILDIVLDLIVDKTGLFVLFVDTAHQFLINWGEIIDQVSSVGKFVFYLILTRLRFG